MLKHQSVGADLVGIWRSKFPISRGFTFYSSSHTSYSKTDYFFAPEVELYRIVDIEILPFTISDHAPVGLKWDIDQGSSFK